MLQKYRAIRKDDMSTHANRTTSSVAVHIGMTKTITENKPVEPVACETTASTSSSGITIDTSVNITQSASKEIEEDRNNGNLTAKQKQGQEAGGMDTKTGSGTDCDGSKSGNRMIDAFETETVQDRISIDEARQELGKEIEEESKQTS